MAYINPSPSTALSETGALIGRAEIAAYQGTFRPVCFTSCIERHQLSLCPSVSIFVVAMAISFFDLGSVSDILRRREPRVVLVAAGLASLAVFFVSRSLAFQFVSAHRSRKIIPSPRVTLLPELSEEESLELPYPPDYLPGARDVSSPYGTIRVYEWGPEDGRKVFLVHGISTPCISLGSTCPSQAIGWMSRCLLPVMILTVVDISRWDCSWLSR